MSRYGFASSFTIECLRIFVSANITSVDDSDLKTQFLVPSVCQYRRAIHIRPLFECLRLAHRQSIFQRIASSR